MIPVLKEGQQSRNAAPEAQALGRLPQMTEQQSRELSRRMRDAYLAEFPAKK